MTAGLVPGKSVWPCCAQHTMGSWAWRCSTLFARPAIALRFQAAGLNVEGLDDDKC